MTTPPLLDAPSSLCAASVVISLKHVVGNTQSPFTLEEQGFRWPGEIWMMDLKLPPKVDRDVFEEWVAFALKLKGSWGRFLMGLPLHKNPRGAATGIPLVNGANQTGSLINTKGWTHSISGIMKRGDCVQYGTGAAARLHKLLADADSDASGNATLEVTPDVVSAPADSSAIVVNNPRGVFRMVDNTVSWSIDPGPVYRFSMQAQGVVL